MALTEIADDLIREYLLYKGFNTTLKVFDSEVKNDKAKGYRVRTKIKCRQVLVVLVVDHEL